ncbi:MAG: FadR family transcriptional regulator [Planctomycetota bacterium]|jgi:GntR family transcriptional repressor for pyruvate dehydrogenase complex|nr:FadR family transcriptional regulator [Planctomycetota bacterium]
MKPVTRVSQTDVAVDQIKYFLLSDRIEVGDKLPTEKEFCETLCVGRSTVREAIRALQVMGYVKIYPGRGAFLETKNLDDATPPIVSWLESNKVQVEDIVEVRIGLETLAAKLASERATAEDFIALDKVRLAFEEALVNSEYDRLGELDEKYHQTLVDASKNNLLAVLNKVVSVAFLEFRKNSFRIKEHGANAVIPHRDILNALRLRDADLAQVFVRRHLEKIREDRENTVKRRESARILPRE